MIEGIDFDVLHLLIIERAALTATPGPWASDGRHNVCATQSDQLNGGYVIAKCHGPSKRENMEYIAAANPRAVLELIRRLRAAQNQLDALLAHNQTRTDELQAAVEQARQLKERFNALTCRIGVACEVQIVSSAYDRIRAEKYFAIDDLEYDLFAEGWKTAIASLSEGGN